MTGGQFFFPDDREARSAAKVAAMESLLIEKGVITGQTWTRCCRTSSPR